MMNAIISDPCMGGYSTLCHKKAVMDNCVSSKHLFFCFFYITVFISFFSMLTCLYLYEPLMRKPAYAICDQQRC